MIHAESFRSGVIHLRRYTNGIPLPFLPFDVQRGNFHVDNKLYNLSPLNDPRTAARHRSRADAGSVRVSIDEVDHVIAPVTLEEIRLYDSATSLNSRSSGTYAYSQVTLHRLHACRVAQKLHNEMSSSTSSSSSSCLL